MQWTHHLEHEDVELTIHSWRSTWPLSPLQLPALGLLGPSPPLQKPPKRISSCVGLQFDDIELNAKKSGRARSRRMTSVPRDNIQLRRPSLVAVKLIVVGGAAYLATEIIRQSLLTPKISSVVVLARTLQVDGARSSKLKASSSTIMVNISTTWRPSSLARICVYGTYDRYLTTMIR